MKRHILVITIILAVTTLSGCTQYTYENPYICENGELTDEQARTIVDHGKTYSRDIELNFGEIEDLGLENALTVRVKKVYSTHYYWEENGLEGFYTDTTLQIL